MNNPGSGTSGGAASNDSGSGTSGDTASVTMPDVDPPHLDKVSTESGDNVNDNPEVNGKTLSKGKKFRVTLKETTPKYTK